MLVLSRKEGESNLNFWVEDPRARFYNAPPFLRTEKILPEPESVTLFSRFFLERNQISYFSDPVAISSLVKQRSLADDAFRNMY